VVVRDEVATFLEGAPQQALCVFAASCAERMAQVATGLLAESGDREDSAEVCVDTVDALWSRASGSSDVGLRPELFDEFPELQPHEEGLNDAADIYAVYSLLTLKYAAQCASGEGASAAKRCAHIALTAMGQLARNSDHPQLFDGEIQAQGDLVRSLMSDASAVDIASLRAADRAVGRSRLAALISRIR
jgi:hypothetical protein